ncbi:MAG: hypothetical protein RMA76_19170 [Deltaproteobacteria bacterium]|jgi:tRNA-binding EMAP/Myf-like protein
MLGLEEDKKEISVRDPLRVGERVAWRKNIQEHPHARKLELPVWRKNVCGEATSA